MEQQRLVSAIQQKMDKLDEAFLYSEAIDVMTYGRQRDKLREELTLAKIEHHTEAVDELDVQGILAFAERILPRASDLWVQASLDYKQRLQALFFPEGIGSDGYRFNRTAATAPLFSYLAPSRALMKDGEPGGNRTHNPQIKSLLLCQLSYRPWRDETPRTIGAAASGDRNRNCTTLCRYVAGHGTNVDQSNDVRNASSGG